MPHKTFKTQQAEYENLYKRNKMTYLTIKDFPTFVILQKNITFAPILNLGPRPACVTPCNI
ncbi:unknown [Prevotella sp. CAG:924]|nr:unknown [Prevotella sp. CAG:924]